MTVEEIRRRSLRAGESWFKPESLKVWNTTIYSKTWIAATRRKVFFVAAHDTYDGGRMFGVYCYTVETCQVMPPVGVPGGNQATNLYDAEILAAHYAGPGHTVKTTEGGE